MSWAALAAIIFWGFSFVAAKVALKEIHPFNLLALRYAIGAILLFFVQSHKNKSHLKTFSRKDWIALFLLALVGVSGHGLLQAYGLLYTTAIDTGWIIAIYPIVITLAARIFLKETITAPRIVGIALGFLGVFLIISKGEFSYSVFRFTSTLGDFLILLSALTWAAFTVGGRGFLSRFPSLMTITPITILGFVTVLPFSILQGGWSRLSQLSFSAWASILFLGIFCSGLAYLFWFVALEKTDSSIVGMYFYLQPFVTMIGAFLFLDETIHWVTLAGGGMALLGVYLTTGRILRTKRFFQSSKKLK